MRPIQAAHGGRPVGGSFHRRRPRRCPAHLPGGAGAGGRGPPPPAHQPAAPGVQAAGSGKTWETFEHHRMPLSLRQQLDHLAQGSFVERGVNVLAFGLPGTGKTHALCALGHRLVEAGHSVLFAPAYRLVQSLSLRRQGNSWPPSATWTTSTSCSWTTWATCPRALRSPRSSSPASPNATNAAPWASPPTWSSPSGSTSSPTPWPPPRPLTGWSITPSSWSLTSPATAPMQPSNGARKRR